VQPLVYRYNDRYKKFNGSGVDLTSYVPGAGLTRAVLIYVDMALTTVGVVSGGTVATGNPVTFPAFPDDAIPSAFVQLTNGQTSIDTGQHITDARPFLGESNDYVLIPAATVEGQILVADAALDWVVGTPLVDSSGNISIEGAEIRNYAEQGVTASPSSPYEIDWSVASYQEITLTENTTFTFSNLVAGRSLTLILIQGGAGSFTVSWPGSVDWPSATAPTLSTGVGDVDVITLFVRNDGSTVLGFAAGLDMG
jgi:hypothetical protein